jgi:predicted DNA-binding protein
MPKQIKLNIPDDIAARLDAICARTGLTRTKAIIMGVSAWIAKAEEDFRILEEAARRKR